MVEHALVLDDVTFSYGESPVLRRASQTFTPGRLTAICGPNGSGKSTLLGVATGQLAAREGRVLLDGKDVRGLAHKARAQAMAMLPQSPDAPAELQVRDLVALGRYARRRPLASLSAEDLGAIDTALAATEVSDLADRALSDLSGGQRQRAWIAMVLAQEAPLILLDEPTNHLDIAHAVETMTLLQRLVAEQGKTVVAVLHDINLMASHADEVVLMQDGEIVASGAFEDTVTEAALSSLYGRACVFGQVPGRERPFIVVS
ncbi:MAG: ABC transporter ATP-binding protein [Pseudomonadota bacterium]